MIALLSKLFIVRFDWWGFATGNGETLFDLEPVGNMTDGRYEHQKGLLRRPLRQTEQTVKPPLKLQWNNPKSSLLTQCDWVSRRCLAVIGDSTRLGNSSDARELRRRMLIRQFRIAKYLAISVKIKSWSRFYGVRPNSLVCVKSFSHCIDSSMIF